MTNIKVGIIGGAGYTGGELIRILLHHPQAEIIFVQSNSKAGNYLHEVHTDLLGETNLKFQPDWSDNIDILFLCLAHGDSAKFLKENQVKERIKIIDLSQDFRVDENSRFVYGLPELNRSEIFSANMIANPGCFATAILLALIPLAIENLIKQEIHISAITGSTGAGQKLSPTNHFSWRNNNIALYKAFKHQHLMEIKHTLYTIQEGFEPEIHFLPFRGNFTRGILAACYLKSDISYEKAYDIYKNYYSSHHFVHLSTQNLDVKQVVNSNNCVLYLEQNDDILLVVSVIDNLLKGASGQAVQNMNIMFGLKEWIGLKFKASAF